MSLSTVLAKLTPEELKELSQAINAEQKKVFGNPLSLRKQEQLMANIFGVKNWQTALGFCQGKSLLLRALKVVAFYANTDNWDERWKGSGDREGDVSDVVTETDVDVEEDEDGPYWTYGGKMAREFMKEMNNEEKNPWAGLEIAQALAALNKGGFMAEGREVMPIVEREGLVQSKKYNPKGKYQKTTVLVEILSEGRYRENYNLEKIHSDIFEGDCSGVYKEINRESLTKAEMKQALLSQGSDPSFFFHEE